MSEDKIIEHINNCIAEINPMDPMFPESATMGERVAWCAGAKWAAQYIYDALVTEL